ncbi:MAG: hypothetical protein LC687_07065, partial [Actinobacteria bacterium]|nr:hypothetical protein [Actinomycetota bacterium]
MTGAYRTVGLWPLSTMRKLAYSVARMHNLDGSVKPDILVGHIDDGYANDTYMTYNNSTGDTAAGNTYKGYGTQAVFADGAALTHLRTAMEAAQNTSTGGGFVTPRAGQIPSALFVQAALASIGDTVDDA